MKTTVKCKVDIKKSIINKAINSNVRPTIKKINQNTLFMLHSDYKGNSFTAAKNVANTINKQFDSELAFTSSKKDGSEIRIEPNSKLVDEYYEVYTKQYNVVQAIEQGIDEFGDSDTNLQDYYTKSLNITQEEAEERLKKCE